MRNSTYASAPPNSFRKYGSTPSTAEYQSAAAPTSSAEYVIVVSPRSMGAPSADPILMEGSDIHSSGGRGAPHGSDELARRTVPRRAVTGQHPRRVEVFDPAERCEGARRVVGEGSRLTARAAREHVPGRQRIADEDRLGDRHVDGDAA